MLVPRRFISHPSHLFAAISYVLASLWSRSNSSVFVVDKEGKAVHTDLVRLLKERPLGWTAEDVLTRPEEGTKGTKAGEQEVDIVLVGKNL